MPISDMCSKNVTRYSKRYLWSVRACVIAFKILVLVYKSLHQQTPNYISAMLHVKPVQRRLRSTSSSPLLTEPRTQATFADKSFSCYAPHLWNQRPELMKTTVSVESFKKLLKQHLFELAYNQ